MSDAQKEILKMLSDHVITVDQAERLLKALNEGEAHKQEPKSHVREGHGHGIGFPDIGAVFESLGETLAEIGPMVKTTMEDVLSGLLGDDLAEFDEEELEDVEPIPEKYALAAGTQMIIMNTWKSGHARGDLHIQGISGDACRIDYDNVKHIRVREDASHFVIQWNGGPLTVEVPETVGNLKIRSTGGNIHLKHLVCPINVKTLGGDLKLLDVPKDFKAKTMGGNISLHLSKNWQGNGRAHTAGGNIFLAIPEHVGLTVNSSTIGGAIKVDEAFEHLESKQAFPGKNTVNVQIGDQASQSVVALKAMGGSVEVRKIADEK